jgi:hypothetical protein
MAWSISFFSLSTAQLLPFFLVKIMIRLGNKAGGITFYINVTIQQQKHNLFGSIGVCSREEK